MNKKDPFTIQTSENTNNGVREIHFTFTHEFKSLDQSQRTLTFETYISQLKNEMNEADDPAISQGILTVLQISEQLFPHIKNNEIPLEEILIVEMGEQAEGSSLTDLLNNPKLH